MTAKKGWGSTVLGWFVVTGDGDPSSAAGDATGSPPEPALAFVGEIPASPGGRVDFPAVYNAAGIADEEQSRVDRASELLRALPAEADAAVKRRIVEASLKSFSVPIDKIIEAGAGEIQALEGYIRAGAADTQKLLDESRGRLAEFEAEMGRIKAVMDQRVAEHQTVIQACNAKKLEIQSVLEFFGQEEVARVVRESPRLIEPKAASQKKG